MAPIVVALFAIPALIGAWVLRQNKEAPAAQRAALIVSVVCICTGALMFVIDHFSIEPSLLLAVAALLVIAFCFALPGIAQTIAIIFGSRPRG